MYLFSNLHIKRLLTIALLLVLSSCAIRQGPYSLEEIEELLSCELRSITVSLQGVVKSKSDPSELVDLLPSEEVPPLEHAELAERSASAWKLLDNARLANVEFEHVKGHSGAPDNERVDQIAVSYSKGIHIKLQTKLLNTSQELSSKSILGKIDILNNPAPKELQKLISRLDMINHVAKHRYSLSNNELAELLEISPQELQEKEGRWQWRDWLVEPTRDLKWRLNFNQEKPSN